MVSVWGGAYANLTLNTGKWQHIAVTFDGKNLKTYVNGAQKPIYWRGAKKEAVPTTFNLKGPSLAVAQPHRYMQGCFKGQIDDLRIYDRALTAKEVAALVTIESK